MKFLLKTLILASLLLLSRFWWDSQLKANLQSDWIQCQKINQLENAEVIILGDSRAMNGINPEIIGDKSLNFSFASNSYTENYLDFVQNNAKKAKTVITAISIQSLTDYNLSLTFNRFREKNCHSAGLFFFHLLNNPLQLKNIDNRVEFSWLHLKKSQGYQSLGDQVKSEVAIRDYQDHYQRYKFSSLYLDNLFRFEKKLREQNIKVLFILMPSKANKFDFDEKLSGINKEKFKQLFLDKKITLLEYPRVHELEFFDGDHFTSESARKFSEWINTLIP